MTLFSNEIYIHVEISQRNDTIWYTKYARLQRTVSQYFKPHTAMAGEACAVVVLSSGLSSLVTS